MANQLAVAVGAQWAAEVAVRRLNDPYPLPVSWNAADASLTDGWDVLVKLATSGAGWPSPPPPGAWAHGPAGLAGDGGQLADVLARVPTGRLVVLGEPGAGKTMLMVRLVLDLLKDRTSGSPVPVLASLASWNPQDQDLHGWLAAQLTIDHPALAYPAPPGTGGGTRVQALLAAGRILPILDGLDEIPDAVRGSTITRINDALQPGERLVVTCRTKQYREAVRPPTVAEVTLRAAAAVQLRSLDTNDVSRYLREDAGGPNAAARWAPVLTALGTQSPVGQALETPLMVGLARAVYNPRPGEQIGALRDPAELCSTTLADRAAVESYLFDAFVPAAYRRVGRWTAQQAEGWLVFLARHLEYAEGGPDLAWWRLRKGRQVGGSRTGVREVLEPARGVRFRLSRFAVGVRFCLVIGVAIGGIIEWTQRTELKLTSLPLIDALIVTVVVGLYIGGLLALTFGIAMGFDKVPGDLTGASSPRAVLARDRHATLVMSLGAGVPFVVVGCSLAIWAGPGGGGFWIFVGLMGGTVSGLTWTWLEMAWPGYVIVSGWLALLQRMPWPLMPFLEDAHQRGVLRQAGAVYQFRHIELQHRLATRPGRPATPRNAQVDYPPTPEVGFAFTAAWRPALSVRHRSSSAPTSARPVPPTSAEQCPKKAPGLPQRLRMPTLAAPHCRPLRAAVLAAVSSASASRR